MKSIFHAEYVKGGVWQSNGFLGKISRNPSGLVNRPLTPAEYNKIKQTKLPVHPNTEIDVKPRIPNLTENDLVSALKNLSDEERNEIFEKFGINSENIKIEEIPHPDIDEKNNDSSTNLSQNKRVKRVNIYDD